MLRNAHSTVSQPRTLNALYRALSSSAPCHSASEAEAARPKPRSPPTRPYHDKDTDPSSSTGQHTSPTRPSLTNPPKHTVILRRLPARDPAINETSSTPNKKHRARKEKSTDKKPESVLVLLRPPALSARVTAASKAGLIDEAVALVENAPLDAQNVVVWNTLLSAVMVHRKYKLAYSLYVDVSRDDYCLILLRFSMSYSIYR